MCLAIPGKIVEIEGEKAVVDYGSEKREARLLNPEIKKGDYVVVQNKLILQAVPEKEAMESIKLWREALANED
ncbi:HypC/HybG/HupF family hydrogenase formation chaperone [Candidatus Woesearchaeota archaeon]|nr:HypC/HybG/HupF family hydrogenase formation chaperone [Candidatus Woesearchaeota archaeon]